MAWFALVLVLLGVCLILWGPHASSNDYLVAMGAKQERLGALGSPKVVVVGGSSAAFGVDSEMLGRVLCRPVVNMGLHAGLGARFMMNEVKGHLGKDDVVIVAFELANYRQPDRTEDVLFVAVDRHPQALGAVPWHQWPRVVSSVLVMRLQALWRRSGRSPDPQAIGTIYRARNFTPQGDMVAHLDQERPPAFVEAPPDFDTVVVHKDFHRHVQQLLDEAREAGAELIFAWPPMPRSVWADGPLKALQAHLLDHGIPIVGCPSGHLFADSLFFDTTDHLHGAGRAMHTSTLVQEICTARPELCCGRP
jgi:hypothetical protein